MRARSMVRMVGLGFVALVVLVWTLLPLYHMLLMSVTSNENLFSGSYVPEQPTFENFRMVFTQDHFFLRHFWRQLFNSLFVAITAVVIVLAIGTMASYVIGRMRPRWGNWVSNAALFTYVIPASFLAIPFYKVISTYHLLDNLWALVFATVTFATPYAIWIFRQYADSSIPRELDEAAEVDGASVRQIFYRIYLPLMAPVLVAVGTYTLLLSWNEYLYAFLLLSTETKVTLPVAMGFFLATDDAPWNVLMATALIYAVPPAILYYAVRRHMVTGLTSGGVKG
jgi:multiple sugar transport system permease protein